MDGWMDGIITSGYLVNSIKIKSSILGDREGRRIDRCSDGWVAGVFFFLFFISVLFPIGFSSALAFIFHFRDPTFMSRHATFLS